MRRGSRLGKYRLERRLGRGGFGEVWKARDTVEARDVALKIASPSALGEFGRSSIEREARIASRLEHPHILRIRNADWLGGRFVLACDLARGSLLDVRGAWRSGRMALRVVREVAAGLAHAHAQGVIHRDVKPENVLIFDDGRAVLCDFDASALVARKTRLYSDAGSLGYIAPEQAYGRPTRASDVFSLGLVAYELLTGVLPTWPFEWPPDRFDRFRRKVPAPLQPVLRRAAEFDPERRYADAGRFLAAFLRAQEQVEVRAGGAPRRRSRRTRPPLRSPLEVEAEWFRRRHGRALQLRYLCHRCEGPIAEAMSVCPWCGSRANSFRNVTRYGLVCPECERGVRPEWTACPWCHAGRFAGNGRRPPPDPLAERPCARPGCPGQLRRYMRYCPLCKRKPRRPWSDPELSDRCPRCRWPVSRAYWRFCPWCGRRESRAGAFSRH
ncbi:MAG: protein kinase [Myxococcota bacterium]